MSKVLLAYTSMSGRNEQIADHIEDYLNNNGVEVEKEQLVDADAYSATDYDGLIVVTYTYGDGQVPDEAQDFYEDIEDVDLEHMKFIVLGSSSKDHVHFGRAVDYFTMQLNSSNGDQIADSVKINQDPDEDDFKRVDQAVNYLVKNLK